MMNRGCSNDLIVVRIALSISAVVGIPVKTFSRSSLRENLSNNAAMVNWIASFDLLSNFVQVLKVPSPTRNEPLACSGAPTKGLQHFVCTIGATIFTHNLLKPAQA